ncbi:MAG: hypothetical protein P8N52_08465 [Crocinitomicaceae bacterium]|nr:hypothetical protein [Crocinitomicaceae bacterium]MDG1776975.1 hypothetical protein [Crocinitomicaceae bacterium]
MDRIKNLIRSFFVVVALSSSCFASVLDVEPVSTWTEYKMIKGVTIEYLFESCNSQLVFNQSLVLFRFTNTTSSLVKVSWRVKTFRNGVCSNCESIGKLESLKELVLNPGESFEGDCSSKMDKRGICVFTFHR